MRARLVAVLLVVSGCGARVEDDPGSARARAEGAEGDGGAGASKGDGAASSTDAGPPPPPGCPITPPANGDPCIASSGVPDHHFYCHYFPAGESCAQEAKCTQSDGTGEPAHFYAYGPACGFTVDACDEGKECGAVFEPDGACIVACTRACRCNRDTGTLACDPIACAD